MTTNYQSIQSDIDVLYPAATPPSPLQRYGSGHLDQDIFGISVSRLTKVQQLVFVRKVIWITTLQFTATCCLIFFIVRIFPLFDWLNINSWVWWIPLIPTFLLGLFFVWQLYTQYLHINISTKSTLLTLYSISMSIVMSNLIAKVLYEEGSSVIIMTIFGLACLLLYTFQKKYSFTGAFPFVCSLGSVCFSSLGLRYVYNMDPLEILFPITMSSMICIYIILELYFIMKNMTQDDYILANVYLFIDLFYPIRFIHHFCELTDNMNLFPDILYPGE